MNFLPRIQNSIKDLFIDILNFQKKGLRNRSSEISDYLGIKVHRGVGHNEPRDAFRHAYSSAITAHKYGARITAVLGEINERIADDKGQHPAERYMDSINNRIGIEIGMKARNEQEIIKMVYQALQDGRLIKYPPFDNEEEHYNYIIKNLQADNPDNQERILKRSINNALYSAKDAFNEKERSKPSYA